MKFKNHTIHAEIVDGKRRLHFVYKSSRAYIQFEDPHFGILYDLESDTPGIGHGSELLHIIDVYCRRRKILLVFQATPYETSRSENPLKQSELISWYKKRNAIQIEDNPETDEPQFILGYHKLMN